MTTDVIVSFTRGKEYHFRVRDGERQVATDEAAHAWLDGQWDALGCEPVRPTGKVLVFDKLLGIARAGGEGRFAENGEWAHRFAASVARLVERPLVVVDVGDNRIG